MRAGSSVSWKAYPALLLAGCLATGIAVAAALPEADAGRWLAAALVLWIAALGLLLWRSRRLVSPFPLARTLLLAGAVALTGGAHYASRQALPAQHTARFAESYTVGRPAPEVVLEGRVTEAPQVRDYGLRFVLAAQRIAAGGDTSAVTGRVQVTVFRDMWEPVPLPAVRVGDAVRLRGQLAPPPHRRNPADFDYGAYLGRRGIRVLLTAGGEDLSILHRAEQAQPFIAGARAYVGRQIDRYVHFEEVRVVLRALILGDRSELDEDTRTAFVRTGLMHLLAVSGLHVMLVGWLLYQVLRPVLVRAGCSWKAAELLRATLTMAALVFYMLLAGAPASVVRAVVMTGLFIAAAVFQRSSHALNTLGMAAVVLLAVRPSQLFDVGFQLSFAAVGAIVALTPLFNRAWFSLWKRRGTLRWVGTTVNTSLAATLGTAPLLLYHFGYVSFAGLALNVVAIPLTGFGLAAGFLMAALGGWAPAVAEVFGAAGEVLLRLLLYTAERGEDALGWAGLYRVPGAWMLGAMTASLVALAQWPRPRLRWRWSIAALALVAAGLWTSIGRASYAPRLGVLFFDVGQGDAALVALPDGGHLLIDSGTRTPFSDRAERVILPHLGRHGFDRLSAVIVSHPDADHLGGLPTLLRSVPVGRVVHSGDRAGSALYAETFRLLDSLRIPHRAVHAGDTLRVGPHVTVRVLWPPAAGGGAGSRNNNSLVLRLAYGQTSVLFTGDVEAEAERALIRHYGPLLASDLVKVAHHGSGTSSLPAFVEHVTADSGRAWAVVSAARYNRFGLPDPGVLRRWYRHDARVRLTAISGAQWFVSDGTRFREMGW